MPGNDAVISKLKIVVTQQADGVSDGLSKLAHSLTEMKQAVKGGFGNNLNKLAAQIENLAKAVDKIDITKFQVLTRTLKAAKDVGRVNIRVNMGDTTRNMRNAANAAEEATEQTQAYVNVIRKFYGVSGLLGSGTPGANVPMGTGGAGDGGLPVAYGQLVKSKEAIDFSKVFGGGEGGRGGIALGNIVIMLNNLKNSFAGLGAKLKGVTARLGVFWGQIKRIAMYRAIRFVLREITQALKTGVDNLYAYSKLVGTTFAPTMDALATSALYWKNSLGAVSGQLIEAVAPVIIQIADGLAEVNNQIAQMIAMLRGQTVYSRAVKVAKEYNEEIGKLKATLLGFDEINRMNGATENGVDYTKYFEEAKVIEGQAKKILDALTAVGVVIAGWSILKLLNQFTTLLDIIGAETMANSLLGKLSTLGHFVVGLTLTVSGITLLWNQGDLFENTVQDKLKELLAMALAVGGLTFAFGSAGLMIGLTTVLALEVVKVIINWDEAKARLESAMNEIGTMFGGNSGWFTNWLLAEDFIDIKERFAMFGQDIRDIAESVYYGLVGVFNSIKRWWNGTVSPLLDNIFAKVGGFVENISQAMTDLRSLFMATTTHESSSGVVHGGGGTHNGNELGQLKDFINDIWRKFWLELGINVFAGGGFPEDGLFFANSGEMVGKFSNGKTAVANNAEITAGIARAVYEAITEAGGIGGGDWTIELSMDGAVTGQAVITAAERANRRNGKTLIAVG